ncbi:MAG: PorV/PorQ family protein [bacterium]|nr:PorV/PorQ family protein [bacterium]
MTYSTRCDSIDKNYCCDLTLLIRSVVARTERNGMLLNPRKLLPLFIILLLIAANLFAKDNADINSKAGTTAFPFLKINVGARAVAMGGAFTGLADDESSLYYNPAGIYSYDKNHYILGYHNYFVDIQTGFAGFIRQLNDKYFLGGYISYLNYGNFVEANDQGEVTGEFSGSDMVVAASFAMRPKYSYSAGATVKLIYESIQEFSSTGLAVDLGFKYIGDREKHSFGIAIQNLGSQLSALGVEKFDLPLTFRAGGAFQPRGLPLTLAIDLVKPNDNDLYVAIGSEYFSLKPLYLRMGWNSFGNNYRARDSGDKWAGLTFGVGFDYKELQLSYSLAPGAELGDSHRITLTGHLNP